MKKNLLIASLLALGLVACSKPAEPPVVVTPPAVVETPAPAPAAPSTDVTVTPPAAAPAPAETPAAPADSTKK